jgi:SAM-dependent methyltransferase
VYGLTRALGISGFSPLADLVAGSSRGYGRDVPDAIFAHPRLAQVYDAFDGPRDDLDAYVAIAAELDAKRVLDIGCGTGCLAIALAGAGRTVVAVDPAAASLDMARAKDGSAAVTWIHGDASAAPAAAADLAMMTGNVAQVFLTDQAWAQVLRAIRTALRPRGYLVFETRRPERRAWEEWAADTAPVTLDVPGAGPVEHRSEVTAVSLPFVSFRDTYTFESDGAVITSESTLRFRGREEVAASLAAEGYQVLDVRDAPDRPGREYVFLAQHTHDPEPSFRPHGRTSTAVRATRLVLSVRMCGRWSDGLTLRPILSGPWHDWLEVEACGRKIPKASSAARSRWSGAATRWPRY